MAATELCSAVSMITTIYLYCNPNIDNKSWISVICADFSLCKHFQGFTAVTDIAGGFSSWRDTKLPITQRPELASSYIPEAQHPVNVA